MRYVSSVCVRFHVGLHHVACVNEVSLVNASCFWEQEMRHVWGMWVMCAWGFTCDMIHAKHHVACGTNGSHVNASRHTWVSHVTYERVMSHLYDITHVWHMDESCHTWVSHVTYEGVMSHLYDISHARARHVAPVGELCCRPVSVAKSWLIPMYVCAMARNCAPWLACQQVQSHTRRSDVTLVWHISRVSVVHRTCERVVLTCDWVMSRVWMGHVAHDISHVMSHDELWRNDNS